MTLVFPHLNDLGINQFTPRKGPGRGSSVLYDVGKISTWMRNTSGELRRTDGAIIDAHTYMAEDLQQNIVNVLAARIKERGRAQKTQDPLEGALFKAILSKKNRDVKLSGFTVGYLDQIDEVNRYFRGLEYGSSVFVGRFLRGWFTDSLTRGGAKLSPVEGGTDVKFVQFQSHVNKGHPSLSPSPAEHLYPGVLITNAIKPYHFFQQGLKDARSGGVFANADTIDIYIAFFGLHGFKVSADIFRLAMSPGGGGKTRTIGLKNLPEH